ncbi:MAG TPA: acyltransferase family protein [Sporolactobacillaceae bacterium]|nr:acyltransferase family protein [Sporolactobacillaceae bacterium]
MNKGLQRLDYLDSLKVALTFLVVAHHAGQPYGGSGGFWPFVSQQTTNLGPFFAVNAAFFMTLFFMVSAYFVPASYDKKGPKRFLKDRLKRIGIPLLLGFLLIVPPLMYTYYINYRGYGYISYGYYLTHVFFGFGQPVPPHWTGPSWPDVQFAHLWFLEHLLFYAVVYCLWRVIVSKIKPQRMESQNNSEFPSFTKIFVFAVLLALVTFVVRIYYPIDRWVGFLGFIQAEFAHVPQYASFFVIGMVAYRKNWLNQLPDRIGQVWLCIGVLLAAIFYIGAYSHLFWFFNGGGFNGGSLLYSFYDTLMCTGLCIGLVYLFKKKLNGTTKLIKVLAQNAFTVYIIHYPIVVMLQYAFGHLQWIALAKFLMVTVLGIIISFFLSWAIIKRIPYLGKIL